MYFFPLRQNVAGQPTFVRDFLTPDECAALIAWGEGQLTLKSGKTADHKVHENLRKSDISWINPEGEHNWLFGRVRDCVNELNAGWFRYDLVGFEGIQFTKYSARDRHDHDFYSSHKDTAVLPGGTVRKLSFTIQLSDSETYFGGEVILYNSLIDFVPLDRGRGSISLFPSYTIHEVRPVTKGTRYSLVGWACGPAFT